MLERTESLIGRQGIQKLKESRVAVFGLGGVGGYAAEALARSGVGSLDLIDHDRVSESNLNRQILALRSTMGMYKTEVAAARILDINPECSVRIRTVFFLPENADSFDFSVYDYIVDAVDTVAPKMALILKAQSCGTPSICALGAGNKMDPAAFRVADIYDTRVCPLAKVIRQQCRKNGVKGLKVVYSEEEPLIPVHPEGPGESDDIEKSPRRVPGSMAFVPPVAGMILAGEVIRDLLKKPEKTNPAI